MSPFVTASAPLSPTSPGAAMSEYVPTTGEIREVWAAFSDYGGLVVPDQLRHAPCWEDRLAEFDRWLNEVKADKLGREAGQ